MLNTLELKKTGKTLGQTDITTYFENWENIITDLGNSIGDKEQLSENTGEYIVNTIIGWLNVDPSRKDGIEYKDENVKIIDTKAFDKVKEYYTSFKQYYEETQKARLNAGASDTTYINDTTYEKARLALYLIYSEFANEAYFGKDLYEAINSIWNNADFDKLLDTIGDYKQAWLGEISQQEYALAHLSGGYANKDTYIYSSPSASEANIQIGIFQNEAVAIIQKEPQTSGWYYVCKEGTYGYIQTKDVTLYNIKQGKFYLEEPMYPTNYEGEQNTIYHQIPINVLENGKAYKWSVTLYWSTSGNYMQDDKIDGSLTSVENYFDTRKRPVLDLKNYKSIFTLESNYVKTIADLQISVEIDGEVQTIEIPTGSNVIIENLDDAEENATIQFIDPQTNVTYEGTCPVSALENLGLYDTDGIKKWILKSREATFKGYYEQEQFVPISYFRWILYKLQNDTEEVVETVKDTGLIPSVDFQFYYDGFLNNQKYAIKIFVQTLDNVEVETDLIKFKTSYIDYEIDNMLNAENSPIEHGIIVEWSNLRLITGELEGTGHYQNDIPTENKTAFTIDKGSSLMFDKDKGQPLSIDWEATQVLCTRFDEERPTEPQIYYTASGLDDNGDVVSKTLEMIPNDETQDTGKVTLRYTVKTPKETQTFEQEIIASQLYWYVIIMKNDELIIKTKYAKGLFPALDQYPDLDKFTGSKALYPDDLIYLEEKSEKVEYNYQKIVDRNGKKK